MIGGIYSPAATQAPIAGKAFIDLDTITRRINESANPDPNNKPLPGASQKSNFQIYPHQLSIGDKQGTGGNYAGDNCEYGLTTAAGLKIEDSVEKTLRGKYFQGVVTSEVPYDGDTMHGSDPIGESYSFLRGGTTTIRYLDTQDAYPFDLLEWTIPIPGRFLKDNQNESTVDDGISPLAPNIKGEVHFNNPVYYAKKFEPRDASLQLMAVAKLIEQDKVKNVTVEECLKGPDGDLDSLDEEAAGLMHAILGIAEIAINKGYTVAELTPGSKESKDLLKDVFGVYGTSGNPTSGSDRVKHCMQLLTSAILAGAYARSERVFARLLNAVKPGDDADIMLQHIRMGF